jgi:hypothetical protein
MKKPVGTKTVLRQGFFYMPELRDENRGASWLVYNMNVDTETVFLEESRKRRENRSVVKSFESYAGVMPSKT